jgi:hypothetical protein
LCVVCKQNIKGTIEGLTNHFIAKGGMHERVFKKI